MPKDTTGNLAGAIRDLSATLRGSVICPGDAEYNAARAVWNARVDCRPALIVRAADATDVSAAVCFAREEGLPLAVRGAGHHPAGYATVDDGLVLDLSGMKGLVVDTAARTARVEAGVTAGEFMHAIHDQGLISTVGSHPTVGMIGMTLGGGMGLLMGKYGLACDNVIAAEVVTADGKQHTASETEKSDLFWAIRGGGGNFGVVTSLTYRLHPEEPTLAGLILHPLERTGDVLRFFREFTANAPDELGVLVALLTGPDGNPFCGLMVSYTGSLEEGERALAPLRAFGPPLVDMVQPAPYVSLLDMFEGHDPAGGRYSYSVRHLPEITDEAIDVIAEFGSCLTSPGTAIVVYHQHGAVRRVPVEATAYAARQVPYQIGIYAGWQGEDAPHIDWCCRFREAIEGHSTGTGYLNLLEDADETHVKAAYAANYARLQQVKGECDPDNLFRRNPNIRPACP